MRLRHIEVFFAVYRHGSISAAAQELHVSQPSVSKVLRNAEDRLGYQLFERIKGRLQPTDAAHELFIEVEHVYDRLRVLTEVANIIRTRRGGHLRLSMLPSLGLNVVPEAIAAYRAKNPEVTFEIDTLHSRDVASTLFERKCDIVIGYGEPRGPNLDIRNLGVGELMLVTPKDAFGDSAQKVDLKLLHGVDFIGSRDSGPSGELFTQHLQESDAVPNVVVTARTYYVSMSLVRLGVGMSVVDNFTASSMLGPLVSAYRFKTAICYPVNAITLSDHPQPVLMADFLAVLAQFISKYSPESS